MGPGRYTPVILQGAGERDATKQEEKKPQPRLQAMRWGLIPSFTKPNAKPDHFVMFNARSENVQERPAYRRLLQSRRCVVLCDGYYEWQQVDKREKQPYYFYREGRPMKFAGLYDKWINEEGQEMYTYTILTTDIAPELKWLHTRMPVVLSDEGVSRWLSDAKFEDLKDVVASYRGSDLKWHPVDKRVGSMQFQSENCAKKVDIKHAGDIKAFFGVKQEKQEPAGATSTAAAMKVSTTAGGKDSLCTDLKQSPLKKEARDTKPCASPTPKQDTMRQTPPAQLLPAGFVPASSLLTKRSNPEVVAAATSPASSKGAPSPSKRPHVQPSPSKMPKAKFKSPPKEPKRRAIGPKQRTLDSFFSPEKNPK